MVDVNYWRKNYPKGTRVELIEMNDPQAPPAGATGTVIGVDDMGTMHVAWDTGGSLGIIIGEDKFRRLSPMRNQQLHQQQQQKQKRQRRQQQ